MRKLLLLLSVILSSMAVVTHAQAIPEDGWDDGTEAGTFTTKISLANGSFETANNWNSLWESNGLTPPITLRLNWNDCGTSTIDGVKYLCIHSGKNALRDVLKIEVPYHYDIVKVSFTPLVASSSQQTKITFPGQNENETKPVVITSNTLEATTNDTPPQTTLYVCEEMSYVPTDPQSTVDIIVAGPNTHCTFKDFEITIKHKSFDQLKQDIQDEITVLTGLAPAMTTLLSAAQEELDKVIDDTSESDEKLMKIAASISEEKLNQSLNTLSDGQLFNIESPFAYNATAPFLATNPTNNNVIGAAKDGNLPSQIWVIDDPTTDGFLLRNYLNNKYIQLPSANNTPTALVEKGDATRFAFAVQNTAGAVGINIYNTAASGDCIHRNNNSNNGSVVKWNSTSPGSVWKLAEADPVLSEVVIEATPATVAPGGTVAISPTYNWETGAPETETFISYAVSKDGEAVTEGITIDGNNITFSSTADDVTTLAPVGTYTVTATSMNLTEATATVTVAKTEYAVTFTPETIAPTTLTEETGVVVTVTQPAAEEGGQATTYEGDWTATLSKKGENDEYTAVDVQPTVDNGTVTITALEAGDYKLTIAPAEADQATTAFTNAELPFSVTEATVVLKSLTASIPADTKIASDATERTVELTVVPTPAAYVVKAAQLIVTIGEGDNVKSCIVAAAAAETEGTEAPANKFSVEIPDDVAVGEQTLVVSFKKTAETTDDIEAKVPENGTLTFEITALPVYAVTLTDGENTVDKTIEMTVGDTKTLTAAFKNGNDAVDPAPTGWTATIKAADAEESTDVLSDGKIVIPATLAAGSYTLTISAPTADADYTFSTKTIAVTVNPAPKPVYSPAFFGDAIADGKVTVEAGKSVGVIVLLDDGETPLTPDDGTIIATVAPATVAVTATYFGNMLTITATDKAEAGTYKVTLAATEDADYKIDDKRTLTVIVTEAVEEPVEGTITGINMVAATVNVANGKGDVTISGTFTLDGGNVAPEGTTVALSASGGTGVTVEFGDVAVTGSKFSSEANVTVEEGTELPVDVTITATYTPVEGEEVSETMTLTVKAAGVEPTPDEPTTGDLVVKNPTDVPDGAVATVDGKTATVGFNATPAKGDATMTIALPAATTAAEDFNPEAFDIAYSVDDVATATINSDGSVTIEANENAAIGATTTITIKAATTDTPDAGTEVNTTGEGDNEGSEVVGGGDNTGDDTGDTGSEPETPADDALLTINVTIYGVEFENAPKTATLGINGPVDVTFETNACVPAAKEETPEDDDQEVTTDAAEEETPDVILSVDGEGATVTGKVITFTQAGTYTVTAKAGDNYVATTTITVNEAPTVTGIEAVNADAAAGNATVYDLRGRRINRVNAAGIYIVNGVKTLVR